jgi:hypothetical protein
MLHWLRTKALTSILGNQNVRFPLAFNCCISQWKSAS